jgi:hypothetical protein
MQKEQCGIYPIETRVATVAALQRLSKLFPLEVTLRVTGRGVVRLEPSAPLG